MMRVVLKIESGAYAGRTILLRHGQGMNFGRTERADYSLPHDDLMSSVHFHVECGVEHCHLRDLGSTNGTRVNDTRIVETELKNGDRVSAGRTTFVVCMEGDTVTISPVAPPVGESQTDAAAEDALTPTESDQASEPVASATGPDPSTISAFLARIDSPFPFAKGLQDPERDVWRETLDAAVRTGQKWLLDYCRCLAKVPAAEHWEALHLLAVLGQPADLDRILFIGRSKPLGPRRFEILASFGHPRVIPDLLVGMESSDAETAIAANSAFAKITGLDVNSPIAASTSDEGDADDEGAEQDSSAAIGHPDVKLAERHWHRIRDEFAKGLRWRRGIEVTRPLESKVLDSLDLESRYEILLRVSFQS